MFLLGVDFRAIAAQQFAGKLVKATLNKITIGAYDVNNPTSGTSPTFTPFACDACITDWKENYDDAGHGLARTVDFTVIIVLGTITPIGTQPTLADTITIARPANATAGVITGKIFECDIDQAGAVATVKCQGT